MAVCYVDFRRAFDSIVFNKLLIKLQSFGICGKLLLWLSAFLINRTQRVVIENCLSVEKDVVSGVPQGSVLGPILFLLFINDIEHICCGSTKFKLFADDLKLYCEVDVFNNSNNDLQNSLNRLASWATEWQLTINFNKCSVLGIHGRSRTSNHIYSINGFVLSGLGSIRDLGVEIDYCLSFKSHIKNCVSRALQRTGILFRGFLCRDLQFLRKAFVTYIRPVVEYNSIIWSPSQVTYIDLVERVQRRFTKRIPCLQSMSYNERLSAINLPSLELRRLHFDLLNYYKIINHQTSLIPESLYSYHVPPDSLRNATPFIQKPRNASSALLSSFVYRSIDCWNFLPAEAKALPNLNLFKAAILKLDCTSFLHGSMYTSLNNFNIFM